MPMSQGKLEIVKQEMASVNIDILGNSELKWMEWVNLIQMTIMYLILWTRILRRNKVAPMVNKTL